MAAYFSTESFSAREKISFRLLQTRLIKTVNARIQNGEFTERGLAKLLGISQPQTHNVLKGARRLSVELADRLLWAFGLTLADLLDNEEVAKEYAARQGTPEPFAGTPGPALDASETPRKQPGQESHRRRSGRAASG